MPGGRLAKESGMRRTNSRTVTIISTTVSTMETQIWLFSTPVAALVKHPSARYYVTTRLDTAIGTARVGDDDGDGVVEGVCFRECACNIEGSWGCTGNCSGILVIIVVTVMAIVVIR